MEIKLDRLKQPYAYCKVTDIGSDKCRYFHIYKHENGTLSIAEEKYCHSGPYLVLEKEDIEKIPLIHSKYIPSKKQYKLKIE